MSTAKLRSRMVAQFGYRGVACEIRHHAMTGLGDIHCGYMTGQFEVTSYDEADKVAHAHGGFTYCDREANGLVTLGFDTGHFTDGPHTQNEAFVTQKIKDAVGSLYEAGVVKGGEV